MFRSSTIAAAFALLAAQVALADPAIQSPALYQCTPAAYQYTCDSTPCTIVIRPADDQTSSLANLGSVSDASGTVTWTPNVAEGTSVTGWITNSQGVSLSNAATSVAAGSDDCMNGSSAASGSSSATSAASGSASSGASTATGATSKTSGSASSSASGSETASAADASSTSDSGDNGAMGLAAGGGAYSLL
ncbi:hypothetical protein JCM10207_001688 [Rhodosporidiobolus poonsookiae]